MKNYFFFLVFTFSISVNLYSQNNTGALLFDATPNPSDDKCLVRIYLPDSDPKAALRLLDKHDSIVRMIDLGSLKGIQSAIIPMSDLPKGTYICQLLFKGLICRSNFIYHTEIDHEWHPFDSVNVYNRIINLELRVKSLDYNINAVRDYELHIDSLYQMQQKVHSRDSMLNKIIDLNREVIRMKLRLESFEQLVRELAILKVRNKLSDNPIKKGNKYTLTRIYFSSGSFDFSEKSRVELDDLVSVLNEFPSLVISINGHTDNVGNYVSNKALSKSRAKSVYDYLLEKGISSSRVTYEGLGSNAPLLDNITDDDRTINRRVEFVIMKE